MIKIIQISDEIFWGFRKNVSLNNFSSIDEIANYIKDELIKFLIENNLLILKDIALKLKLHNHQYNSYDELYETNENIIYLCGACCS